MNKLLFVILLIGITLIFKEWFLPGLIASGDFTLFYFNPGQVVVPPYIWDYRANAGLGGYGGSLFWLMPLSVLPNFIFSYLFKLPWELTERIAYFFPFIIFSVLSIRYCFNVIFPKSNYYWLASLIYLTNTYSLMIIGGGQVGYALGYAFAPFFIGYVFNVLFITQINIRSSIAASILFSIMLILDIRVAYMSLIFLGLLVGLLWVLRLKRIQLSKTAGIYGIIFIITTGILNAFWLMPVLFTNTNPISTLDSNYTSLDAVRFYSFARLEHAFSLLHPYWPENIFGKVSFFYTSFLVIPALVFVSLLLPSERKFRSVLLVLTLIAVIFIFISKGSNEPFGFLYEVMFSYIPGFVMFRDPTKWYFIIVLTYSMIIPLSLEHITKGVKKYFISVKPSIVIMGFIILWGILIREGIIGQLNGTFKTKDLPIEYQIFYDHISDDNEYYRTLWVPSIQRFAYYSPNNPAVSAADLFNTTSIDKIVAYLEKSDTKKLFQEYAIQFVILPHDTEKELFIEDRNYNPNIYLSVYRRLQKISWLTEQDSIGSLKIFKAESVYGHFWIVDKHDSVIGTSVDLQATSPIEYSVKVQDAFNGDRLVFSEYYDPNWEMRLDGRAVPSKQYKNLLNSFELPKSGTYSATIYYTPQDWVNRGLVVSGVSLVGVVGSLVYLSVKGKRNGN